VIFDRILDDAALFPPLRAKFRTGGVTADAYPDEPELAEAIHLTVAHGLAFKATAGLHHAVRNTDPATGFEQHGFLNIIAAVAAATDGSGPDDLAANLRSRDGIALAESVAALTDQQATDIRRRFCRSARAASSSRWRTWRVWD
jgi:hypothetical protein